MNQTENQRESDTENISEKKKMVKKEKAERERMRINALFSYEREAIQKGYRFIAGTDEAGRGPIAGPVVAAAVILEPDTFIEGLNDSKKISEKKREIIFDQIMEKCLASKIIVIDNETIDKINILQSANLAMKQSVEGLTPAPDFVLVDGLHNSLITIPQLALTKGDSKSASIAAASILAKVYRDRIMKEYDVLYPEYGFASHKGYPTKKHTDAVKKYGILKIHRKTFTPISTLI